MGILLLTRLPVFLGNSPLLPLASIASIRFIQGGFRSWPFVTSAITTACPIPWPNHKLLSKVESGMPFNALQEHQVVPIESQVAAEYPSG